MEKTQDRTISIGDYRFNEKAHLHELLKDGEYKPLTGVTTVLSVIAKPMLIQWSANEAIKCVEAKLKELYEVEPLNPTYILAQIRDCLPEAKVAHRKKKESAGEWGTEVHTEVEKYIGHVIKTGDITGHLDMDKRIQPFVNWAIENKVKFLASEKHVYSKSMWVGGICDIICEIDGKRYVGDIKTSSGIYPEAFIQCSAYAEMLKEMKEFKCEKCVGEGWYADHDVMESHNPEDGSCMNCPIQVQCDDCKFTGSKQFDGVIVLNLKKDGTFDYKYNYDIEGNFECFQAALTIYRQLNAIK